MEAQATDQISFRTLIFRLKAFLLYMLSRKWWIIGTVVLFVVAGLLYNTFKSKEYTSVTTFVLQNAGDNLNEISSLASIAGVNLGSLSESSDLFQIDNIQELYRSHRMISKTMLTEMPDNKELLVHRYIDAGERRKKWRNKQDLKDIDFSVNQARWTIQHDSLLLAFTKEIRKEHLSVSKPSRKLSILNVAFTHEDELFAKAFNEALVENVNAFYKSSKTKKSGDNMQILQHQADSVKEVLDEKLAALAEVKEAAPNLNPLYKTALVPEQKLMIDVRSTSAVYEVIVKNLELAKVSHRNNTPLIQIIDYPILPLESNKWKPAKTIIIAALLGLFLSGLFFTLKRFYDLAMREDDGGIKN